MKRGLSPEDLQSIEDLRAEVVQLRVDLTKARGSLAESEALRKKENELAELERKVSLLQIDKDRIEEGFARERREIEHKVGLEQTRQTQELDLGKREAMAEVREENLTKDKDRFEEQMKFNTERFEREYVAMRSIIEQVLTRLPNITEHVSLSMGNNALPAAGETSGDNGEE